MENERVLQFNVIAGIILKKPMNITVKVDDGLHVAVNEELSIHTWGKNEKELMKNIDEQVTFLKESYLEEDDENLSKDARKLKEKLSVHFEKVGKKEPGVSLPTRDDNYVYHDKDGNAEHVDVYQGNGKKESLPKSGKFNEEAQKISDDRKSSLEGKDNIMNGVQ